MGERPPLRHWLVTSIRFGTALGHRLSLDRKQYLKFIVCKKACALYCLDVLDYDYICKGASHNGRVNIRANQIVATSIQQERSETEQYWDDGCLISAGVPYGGIVPEYAFRCVVVEMCG